MLYFNRHGVYFKIPIAQNAVYDRDLLESQIKKSLIALQNLKDRSPDLDNMRYELPGQFEITSIFGSDLITIFPPSIAQKKKEKEKTKRLVTEYLPAIELYDYSGIFKGIAVCESGSFNPPYSIYRFEDYSLLDPFLWGQWQLWYDSRPFDERTQKLIMLLPQEELYNVPNTGERYAEADYGETDEAISGGVDGPSDNYACCMMDDENCTDGGKTCGVQRYAYYPYVLNTTWEESINYRLIDYLTKEYDSDVIPSSDGSFVTVMNTSGTIVYPFVFIGTFCTDGPGYSCDYCQYVASTLDFPPAPGFDELEHFPADHEGFYVTDEVHSYNNYIDDAIGRRGTNYEDTSAGGMLVVLYSGERNEKTIRTDGASGLDPCAFLDGNVWDLYGEESYVTAGPAWAEGVLLDGEFYQAPLSGEGFYWSIENQLSPSRCFAQYWGNGAVPGAVFAASALRYDLSGFPYFFVNKGNGKITVTEFEYSHWDGVSVYHTLTDLSGLYGKGYFRMVKRDRVFETEGEP